MGDEWTSDDPRWPALHALRALRVWLDRAEHALAEGDREAADKAGDGLYETGLKTLDAIDLWVRGA